MFENELNNHLFSKLFFNNMFSFYISDFEAKYAN